MYFANLNAELNGRGKSVTSLINEMNQNILSGAPNNDITWMSLLDASLGKTAVHEWQNMRDGQLLIPSDDAFGDSFASRRISTGFFSLGYFPEFHTQGTVIERLEPGSNAESAGLLPGDKLLDTTDISPFTHSFNNPMRLSIERRRKVLDVTFDPHTQKNKPAWSWYEGPEAK